MDQEQRNYDWSVNLQVYLRPVAVVPPTAGLTRQKEWRRPGWSPEKTGRDKPLPCENKVIKK